MLSKLPLLDFNYVFLNSDAEKYTHLKHPKQKASMYPVLVKTNQINTQITQI